MGLGAELRRGGSTPGNRAATALVATTRRPAAAGLDRIVARPAGMDRRFLSLRRS